MYFDARGKAEATRMLLTLAGQEFEDYRFKEGEWPGELKGNTDRKWNFGFPFIFFKLLVSSLFTQFCPKKAEVLEGQS